MTRRARIALMRLLVFSIGLWPVAVVATDTVQVRLRAATFDPLRDGEPRLDDRLSQGFTLRKADVAPAAWLIQFRVPIGAALREELARRGVTVVGYVPQNTLLVQLPTASGQDVLRSIPEVRWSGALRPVYRLAPEILDRLQGVAADTLIDVQLFAGTAPDSIVEAVARRWPDVELVHVKRSRRPRLTLFVPAARLKPVVGSLIRDPEVLFVSRRWPLELHNDSGVWIGQSYDRIQGPLEALEPDPKPYADSATIWNRGLRGEGQVIAVADTGLEHEICFFDDPGHPVVPQTVTPPAPLTVDPRHRKLLAFNAPLAPSLLFDDSFRHGTHVTGIAAGDNLVNMADGAGAGHDHADGMAPAARLIFEDISGGVNAVCSTSIVVDSLEDLLEQEYLAGARISNNSWGSSAEGFDSLTYETDVAGWVHEDMLIVASVGNNGGAGVGGLALCKNCVAIGASESYDATFNDEFGILDPENMAAFSSRGPTPDGRIKPDLVAPGYIVTSSRFPVIYIDDETDAQCNPGPDVCLPNFGGCYVTDTSDTCHAAGLLGTSMSSPAVSGLAALARQYFTEGFYPTGQAQPANAHDPSAALLKAVLINGARNLTGHLYDRRGNPQDFGPLADAPSNVQGWGRAMLDDVLYFDGDARRLIQFDVPNGVGLVGNESIDVTLSVSSAETPLKATLVWSDTPALPVASGALVNDLDLVITAPGGTVYRGNQWTLDDVKTAGDKVSEPGAIGKDDVNNVEGVLITAPTVGVYTVSVRAGDIPSGPQGGALVVSGTVEKCTATDAPQNAEAVAVAADQIDLSWDAVPGAVGYVVRRNASACSSPMAADQIFAVAAELTSFSDTTVPALSTFNYTVRAVVSVGGCQTADSDCVSATTPAPPPPAVRDLVAERRNPSGTAIDVEWDTLGCPAPGYHLLAGDLDDVGGHAPLDAECDLPTNGLFHWLGVPAGSLWFLVVGDDDNATEGSWGLQSDGTERNGGSPSLFCGMLVRSDGGSCP